MEPRLHRRTLTTALSDGPEKVLRLAQGVRVEQRNDLIPPLVKWYHPDSGSNHGTMSCRTIKVEVYDWDRDGR